MIWDNLFKEERLKSNLLVTSIYLCAYDFLKYAVVNRIKDFFIDDYYKNKIIINEKYQKDVLSLDNNKFTASLLWLKNMGAIDNTDIQKCESLKSQRDDIAHELLNLILTQELTIKKEYLKDTIYLLEKIENWWLINIEIPSNPDYDKENLNESEVSSLAVIVLKHMLNLIGEEA